MTVWSVKFIFDSTVDKGYSRYQLQNLAAIRGTNDFFCAPCVGVLFCCCCCFKHFKANLSFAAQSCVIPLGIESGHLPDSALSASSSASAHYYPQLSRLNKIFKSGNYGAWCAGSNDGNQWLQVNFGRETTVTKVATQGRNNGVNWVRSYSLSYSTDGIHWAQHTLTNGHVKVTAVKV